MFFLRTCALSPFISVAELFVLFCFGVCTVGLDIFEEFEVCGWIVQLAWFHSCVINPSRLVYRQYRRLGNTLEQLCCCIV